MSRRFTVIDSIDIHRCPFCKNDIEVYLSDPTHKPKFKFQSHSRSGVHFCGTYQHPDSNATIGGVQMAGSKSWGSKKCKGSYQISLPTDSRILDDILAELEEMLKP